MGMGIVPTDEEEKRRIKMMIQDIEGKDVLATILRETLGAVPVIGPGLTELVNLYIPNSSFEKLLDFAIETKFDLLGLAARVNQDYLKTDAAAFMVKEVFREVGRNYRQEKLEALRGAFLNSVITSTRDDDAKELYLKMLENMTHLHLRLLSLCYDPGAFVTKRGIRISGSGGALMGTLEACLTELDRAQISVLWNDLHNMGILNGDSNSLMGTASDTSLQQVRQRLNEFGNDFALFIMHP
jgi:hypothetical protein